MLATVKCLFSKNQEQNIVKAHTSPQKIEHARNVTDKKPGRPRRKLPVYDYNLIETLESEHKVILSIYDKVMHFAEEKNFPILSHLIDDFSVSFAKHIHKEDEELYRYMESVMQFRCKAERKVFSEFRSEMKNMSISIISIINQNPNIPVNDNTVNEFVIDFNRLGEILRERIAREETIIYRLYSKCRKVHDIS